MTTRIDFLSFSIALPDREYTNDLGVRPYLFEALEELVGEYWFERLTTEAMWHGGKPHRPFSSVIRRDDNTMSLFWNYRMSHALMEITGAGCAMLDAGGNERGLLSMVQNNASRLDIATDFLTDVNPREFADQRTALRHRSGAEMFTPSGHTVYVGARTSNRFARVYRYASPHPRSRFLRVEHELKHKDAKLVCREIVESGLIDVQLKLGASFGWSHPLWNPEKVSVDKLPAWTPDLENADSYRWLTSVVVPAMRRLHDKGKIDLPDFLKEHFPEWFLNRL